MANFPVLKTGAVAQYPVERQTKPATLLHEFVDGSEQRFAHYSAPLRRWRIRLDLLDEAEMFRIEEFFAAQQGEAGEFVFTDPWDGREYPKCSFESGALEFNFEEPGRGSVELVVRENR